MNTLFAMSVKANDWLVASGYVIVLCACISSSHFVQRAGNWIFNFGLCVSVPLLVLWKRKLTKIVIDVKFR